jgi:O-antigen/teichoic acid export membrane protein
LFWTCCGVGAIQALVLLAASPWLADTYAIGALLPMVAATGLKVFCVSASIVPHQLLAKHLRFRESGIVQTLCSLAEGSAKIGLASLGFGAWTLVLANVVRGLVLLGSALWLADFRPRAHFLWAEARGYLSFGARIAGSGALYQTYRNADYFLIGKLLGVEVLGLYRVAFEVGMQPLEVLLNLVNRVAYPIYAKVADDRVALRTALLRSTRSLLLLGAPIVAFLDQSADHLLAVVTAHRWSAATPAIAVLAWGCATTRSACSQPGCCAARVGVACASCSWRGTAAARCCCWPWAPRCASAGRLRARSAC